MTTYIKIEEDSDEVTVTFVSDAIFNTETMTKAKLVEFING